MITYRGTIAAISGHPMSGLWNLHFEDGTSVHIESGHGVRQLAACYGAHEGTGDLQDSIEGQDIIYSVDCFNILCGFTPTHEWEGPPIPIEGLSEEELNEWCETYNDGLENGEEEYDNDEAGAEDENTLN